MRFEILVAVKMSNLVLWVATPCGVFGEYQRSGGEIVLPSPEPECIFSSPLITLHVVIWLELMELLPHARTVSFSFKVSPLLELSYCSEPTQKSSHPLVLNLCRVRLSLSRWSAGGKHPQWNRDSCITAEWLCSRDNSVWLFKCNMTEKSSDNGLNSTLLTWIEIAPAGSTPLKQRKPLNTSMIQLPSLLSLFLK
jgi:hypothetical protein